MAKVIKLNYKNNELKMGEKMLCAGTAACTADIVSFPLDVAKVRLQIATTLPSSQNIYRGLFDTLIGLVKNEGASSLYRGISPGLQRQCVFASIRIGLYEPVKDFYESKFVTQSSNTSTVLVRIASAITTGAIGITVAQPTDVVKVRFQSMSTMGTASGMLYRNSLHAYRTIYRTEGIQGLWKGLCPNIVRNSVVNAAELVCYDTVKEVLLKSRLFNDNFFCHFTSAFTAGFCATFVSSPIDVVKTNYMNSTSQYTSVIHCARSIGADGGLKAFYKGFIPSFMRLGTWNVVMFVTFEQLKKMTVVLKEERATAKLDTSSLLKGKKSIL